MLKSLLFFFCAALTAFGANTPDEFRQIADHVFKLHETARVISETRQNGERLRRVTIAATVLDIIEGPMSLRGSTILIDYTVNLDAMDRTAAEYDKETTDQKTRLFMTEPEPPVLDKNGDFPAYLARAGGRLGNVNRYAGAVVGMDKNKFTGEVFVPVAGQFSFVEAR